MYTNATIQELETALAKVNKNYNDNLIFNRLEQKTKDKVIFTLKIRTSKQNKGTRMGFQPTSTGKRKRLASACWHAHGDFFDALFDVNPDVYVDSSTTGRITKDDGNWEDKNIGSIISPMMFSEACFCNALLPHPKLKPEYNFNRS